MQGVAIDTFALENQKQLSSQTYDDLDRQYRDTI